MNKFRLKKGNSIVFLILAIAFIAFCGVVSGMGIGEKHTGAAKNIILGLDLKGGVSVTYQVKDSDFTKEEMDDTIYKLQQRVANYSTESEVYKEGDDRITVDIPGQYDAEAVLAELGKPGSLMFVTVADSGFEGSDEYPLYVAEDGTNYKVWLSGTDVEKASGEARTNQTTSDSEYVVSLILTSSGTSKFAEATSQNLNKSISILFDDEIISSPTVQSVITNGEAVITGMSSLKAANNLASTIRIGSLSLELEEISSKVVSAKLGDDAIETSLLAGLIGIILIMIFMIIVYRVPGVVASIALAFYTILELLVLNGFDLTLTLPGIAGIILSIGMAVDANVIIFARIKEEIAAGKTVESAIKIGFKKATSAIVDGNVTTFIASLVLMWKGTGPVQGFANTLAIGIALSMFTALAVSRVLIWLFYHAGCKGKGCYGVQKERKTINFLGKKAIWFTISIVCILAGIAGGIAYQVNDGEYFNYSIEFKGGTATTVEFAEDISISKFNDEIKPELAKVIDSNDIHGSKENGTNRYTIKTQELTTEVRSKFKDKLVELGAGEGSIEETNISSSVSDEMKQDAIIAVVLATVCMLLYIWLRFSNLRFASSAVLALIHDVLIVLGFYALSRTTVGTTFIACMLTIVGYSINATIVIFDRIRENLAEKANAKEIDLAEVVNRSITQTLTRSIYTSLTTFISVFVLYILGVAAIKEFALPIMVGIIFGGYSSVFITGSLWYIMSKSKYQTKKSEKNKKTSLKKN